MQHTKLRAYPTKYGTPSSPHNIICLTMRKEESEKKKNADECDDILERETAGVIAN